ncbi:MAG: glycosyltransferase 87 family protein [Lachnospiraceae bacterium]|nr:glycosyltransferase 87 family protein [Lachnospiraceae bacterium]
MEEKKSRKNMIGIRIGLLLGCGLLLRIILAVRFSGYYPDMIQLLIWGERLMQVGPGAFYTPEIQMPYPPGYLWIIYGLYAVLMQMPGATMEMAMLWLKVPAMFCDLAASVVLYFAAGGRKKEKMACAVAALYMFNPAVLFNSAIWGQTESCFTLCVICMCVFLVKEKVFGAMIAFGIGLLLKQQTIVFTPVMLYGMLRFVWPPETKKKILTLAGKGCVVISVMVLICLPFHIDKSIDYYFNTLEVFNGASMNAFNFWALVGRNQVEQSAGWLFGIPAELWGKCFRVLVVLIGAIYVRIRWNGKVNAATLGALMIIPYFTFGTAMHERYLYSAMAMLLLSWIQESRKSTIVLYFYFSILQLLNVWAVYAAECGTTPASEWLLTDPQALMRGCSAAMVLGCMIFYGAVFKKDAGAKADE